MPILANAKKALRSSRKKAQFNLVAKSKMRTMIQAMRTKPTPENLSQAFSSIDRAVKRNLVHRNKAARLKSQVSALLSQ